MGAVRIRTPFERVAREYIEALSAREYIEALSARSGMQRRPEVAARGLYLPYGGLAKKGLLPVVAPYGRRVERPAAEAAPKGPPAHEGRLRGLSHGDVWSNLQEFVRLAVLQPGGDLFVR
jgi:hypothetical protein